MVPLLSWIEKVIDNTRTTWGPMQRPLNVYELYLDRPTLYSSSYMCAAMCMSECFW